ncbi:MutS protein msh5 [Lobulomyces angularis]|nr:MutS protein msh5 [Lobulomyces angularis]
MRPSLDIKEINARQDCISLILYADKKEGGLLIQNLKGILRKLGNVEKVINNLKKKSSLKDFEFLSKFCLSCLRLKEFLEDLFEDVNLNSTLILKNLIDSIFHKDVTDLCQKILQVVDFDESELNEDSRTVVKVGVDLELDAMKVKFHGLDEYLGKVAYQVSANLKLENPKSSLRVIYFPQLGYLIALPFQSDCDSFKDIQGLIFQFCTASTVYYKNDTMFELDESLGDLHSLIADREIEIIQTLQEKILPYSRLLTKISKHSAELDCILSFAEASKKYGYTRPKVTEENFLEIVEGRHPLQELCVASFIPNDVTLGYNNNGYGKPSGIVLTGPNFSGKSVYLKEIALIVFMSHIGSFVPAKQATIGLTDKIFTRVQTRESVSKMESAFMIDLHQVSVALRSCTRRSLVLFDEFGKGTQSSDGVGLFCATIEHLISKKKEAPKFLAATHFHEIFFLEKQILNFEENQIQKLTMDIYQEDADGLIFLYKVSPGIALSSWGLYCASLANIPDKIVQRGKEISILVSKGKDLRVDSVEGYYLKKLGKNCITAVENFCEQFFPSLFFKKKLECTEDDIKGNDTERLFSKLEQFENII